MSSQVKTPQLKVKKTKVFSQKNVVEEIIGILKVEKETENSLNQRQLCSINIVNRRFT